MVSERMRRRLNAFLDAAEAASDARDWAAVAEHARAALAIDPTDTDALTFLRIAAGGASAPSGASPGSPADSEVAEPVPAPLDAARVAELAAAAERSGNPLDRLEEGVFVGRTRELERLRSAFDDAAERRGSVVMLVGEPGIGKTRTTQELEAYARTKGAQVLWGGAHESAGAPPYWPWVQLGRAYRDLNPEETRRKEWEPYAVELQRLFNLRALFPNLPEPPAADSEEAQFRLFDAMAGFLRGVSERVPLLLVLDDLHWADSATLQLLAHVGREVGRARILILGTYRDTDLDRRHPLSRALAQMNREALFSRIVLRGLAESETADYLRRTAGIEPERALVHRIYEETEGNPFFLAQVVNLMAQEGTLSASARDVQLPEGVREALGRRLDRLSEEANALLTTLAVAGREFDHALVQALSGHDDETLLGLLEEALRGRVLEETGPTTYRFTHALMQETLLAELSAARRVLLHGQIAEAMEKLYGLDDRDHLAVIAEHYAEAAVLNREHAEKAAHTLRAAADRATAVFDWDDAIRWYERCLTIVTGVPDRFGEDEAALLLSLAVAKISAGGQRAEALDLFDRVTEVHQERGDHERLVSAWFSFGRRLFDVEIGPRLASLNVAVEALGQVDSEERCLLLSLVADSDHGVVGDAAAAMSEAIAERIGLRGDRFPWRVGNRAAALAMARGEFARSSEIAAAWAARRDREQAFSGLPPRITVYRSAVFAGDVSSAVESLDQVAIDIERRHDRSGAWVVLTERAIRAWKSGRQGLLDESLAQVPPGVTFRGEMFRAEIAFVRGDMEEALRLIPPPTHPDASNALRQRWAAGMRARVCLALGDHIAANRAFVSWLAEWEVADQDNIMWFTDTTAAIDDAICVLGDDALCTQVLDHLERLPLMRSFLSGATSPDHLRGALCLRLGRVDEAAQHFRTGLDWASRSDVRFDVDAGRCRQGLAEVAERRRDRMGALEHLDAASVLFAGRGAKLYLEQVRAKQAALGA